MGARTKALNHLAGADGGAAGADADASPVPTPKPRHRSLRSLRLWFGRVGSRGGLDNDDDSLPAWPLRDGVPPPTPTRVAGSADGQIDDRISDEAGRTNARQRSSTPKRRSCATSSALRRWRRRRHSSKGPATHAPGTFTPTCTTTSPTRLTTFSACRPPTTCYWPSTPGQAACRCAAASVAPETAGVGIWGGRRAVARWLWVQ